MTTKSSSDTAVNTTGDREAVSPILPEGTGHLGPYVDAGILGEAELQSSAAVLRALPGTTDEVLLAVALCVRALQMGHVCVDLDSVAATVLPREQQADGDGESDETSLDWPDPQDWEERLRSSEAVTTVDPGSGDGPPKAETDTLRPLVLSGSRVYLERYWRFEQMVGDKLLSYSSPDTAASGTSGTAAHPDPARIEAVLDELFGPEDPNSVDLQREGARTALTKRLTVLAGGPGTGKTHTIARTLAAAHQLAADSGEPLDVALAAPTGKAAARMTEAVRQAIESDGFPPAMAEPLRTAEAGTIHRLLGYRDGINFRHDAANPLPHDLVVVDETSMVALPLMARLLDALRPTARLVLVGDPHQLASVEAGAVLGDIVGPLALCDDTDDDTGEGAIRSNIVVLQRVHRFEEDSSIAELALAVRTGDADAAIDVLADSAATEVTWVRPDQTAVLAELREVVLDNAASVVEAAKAGDAEGALTRAGAVKVLCGTRYGPLGSITWREQIERRLRTLLPGTRTDRRWYVGRPVIVTENDYITKVFNGDTGVVVERDSKQAVAMSSTDGTRFLMPSQLASTDTWWAMTIHKSQGSEFDHAVVSIPEHSRVLTRELLYTGVTRGKEKVTVVASEAALRAAIERPVARASGLGVRLWR